MDVSFIILLFLIVSVFTVTSSIETSINDVNNLKLNLNLNKSKSTVLIARRLTEGSVDVVFLNVSDTEWEMDDGSMMNGSKKPENFYIVRYFVTSRNPRVARILNSTLIQTENDEQRAVVVALEEAGGSAISFKIAGRSVGRTVIDISVYGYSKRVTNSNSTTIGGVQNLRGVLSNDKSDENQLEKELRMMTSFDVCVLRRSVYNRLSSAFTVFVAVITIATTFLIGTQLDWKIILKELKKPFSLLIGIGCEFILMPLIAFALGTIILRGNYGWQLAILAIGACPGGGHSPFWTMMLDGNLDLSVAMSFVANVAALGVLPFWLFTLGRVFYGGRVTIPYLTIMGSLFGLICPIFFGLAFKHFLPNTAERIGKILKLITLISFIMVGIFGCVVNSYVFALLDWRHFVCGMLLPWSGFVVTYPLARFILRRSHEDTVAIAVENGCLNVAVPIVLLQLSLTQPDADLSLVVPVGIVICSSWPLWAYFVYLLVQKRFITPVRPSNPDEHSKPNSSQITPNTVA